jgi:hypothetical protein
MSGPVEIASTFAAGAAGALSMVKLLRMMDHRKGEPERKRIAALFPNGEKAEIIAAIDALKQDARDRHQDILRIESGLYRLSRELGISL